MAGYEDISLSFLLLALSAAVVLTAILTTILISSKMRSKVTYMLDELEDKELNFRFDEKPWIGRRFNRTLNRLRNIFDKERHEIMEQEKYFGLMLDHVSTGIAAIEKSGRVMYCNNTALSLLGMSSFSNIRQLKTFSENLYNVFLTLTGDKEAKASYYNESGKMTLSITSSATVIGKKEIRILAFNDISNEMAETEQESWTKLIRVLTHEIMNTVTPISSLSDTLLQFNGTDEAIRNGLDTISQSSKELIKFVESYRNLTRIASPVKKAFYFKPLAQRVINLTKEQATAAGANCTYIEKTEDILLYADEGQISQILINLIKNAIQAGATTVTVSADINSSEQVVINIFNNGAPISKASQEEIFIPFFTTKSEGTGIGLSISRQIMRLHNGSITLTRSDSSGTVFTLVFR